ncbi:hypothetical protein RHMOL_Rhmol01G0375500 [Rhododendron molle]|uniref:Uncharacterized protein n=1 Tax=Rhododendron molle TaxID=49168 RepID=A0ACC0QAA9_RHOML|nr:hypothetical protein RHMOL_Rhmol01G0375500 [Rhododendron molle]
MAEATFALNQHFLFGLSNSRTTTWLPNRKTLFPSQRSPPIFLSSVASSSSLPPPSSSTELDSPTAESCVNLGLSFSSPKDGSKMLYLSLGQHLLWILIPWKLKLLSTTKPVVMPTGYRWSFSAFLPIVFFIAFAVFLWYVGSVEARLGGEDIGYSFRRDLKLISEVQAPFRGVRRFFYVAFSAAAGISLFFTVPRLIRAIHGGDDAPDVLATAENAAINVGGIIIFVALFFWDNKKEEEQLAQTSRNETLSRWMEDQQKSEGVTPGEDVYIILRLDGRVRISGKGMPDWQQIVKELPPMEALLSKL